MIHSKTKRIVFIVILIALVSFGNQATYRKLASSWTSEDWVTSAMVEEAMHFPDHSVTVNNTAVPLPTFVRPNYIEPAVIDSAEHLLKDFNPFVERVFTCDPWASRGERKKKKKQRTTSLDERSKKLAFVHVYKTAGSTFRMLFLQYARTCKFGITIVAHCSELSAKSMVNGSHWMNRDKSRCRHNTFDRRGRSFKKGRTTINTLKEHVDIAIGHMPLGLQWSTDRQTSLNDVQYISFFRAPLEKYVSGVVYANKQYKNYPATVEATVQRIKTFVREEVKHGKYRDSYSAYLLTPWDKDEQLPDIQAKVKRILYNLVHYPTMIGIVEKMESSLELIVHVVGNQSNVRSLFQQANLNSNSTSTKSLVRNKSDGVDTKAVIEMLKADTEFYGILKEYLKYDAAIYEFTSRLHDEQYQFLRKILEATVSST
jgi:hypothetical protein